MHRYLFLMAALGLMVTAPAPAATLPAAVIAPINAVIALNNADKTTGLDTYYTSKAVVVDEFPPYAWTGATAGTQWWTTFNKRMAQMDIGNVHATTLPVKYFRITGNLAYVVVPLNLTYTYKGKSQHETGLWAFTLSRSGGSWKIATQSWATASDTM